MDAKDTVLVIGTGKSGIAAAECLLAHGKDVILFDGNRNLDIPRLVTAHPVISELALFVGDLPENLYDSFDTVVPSPGVPMDHPLIRACARMGKYIIGEIELAFQYGKGRVCAITGTNGKTTTTALTGVLLAEQYKDVRVVGNIGDPYTAALSGMTDETCTVAEVSSFQLESIDTFRPAVSAILNITPDHLDRHHTMEAYIAAKEAVAANQTENDVCVLNAEDPVLRRFGNKEEPYPCNARVVWFSSARKLENGYYYDRETRTIYAAEDGVSEPVIRADELRILGLHNMENAMAAIAAASAMGVGMEAIRRGLKKFNAVEHRIEFVAEINGVKCYNDSKGTNPDAAIKAICAMEGPTVLIGGGYDKHSEYDEWTACFSGRVKKLLLIGATAQKIAESARKNGFEDIEFCATLEEAVDRAMQIAGSGDAILLSPACASWDMFPNYEERGRLFKEYVRKYEHGNS